jgi:methyl-accepting chemotaxis protein
VVSHVSSTGDKLAQQQNELMQTIAGQAETSVARSIGSVFFLLFISLAVCGYVMFTVVNAVRILKRAVAELGEGSIQVAGASAQISSSSQLLAQGASEQAASIEETSASTEEIGSMTRRNTENSKSSADLVTQSAQKIQEANLLLDQTVTAMNEINGASDKIAEIIKVIDEIAFQTNILALNAAVEAARAGESGLGFAVVAGEVRNLSQRCAQAAKDTALLIEDSIVKAREGKTRVDQTALAIRVISEQSTQMKMLSEEVNLGSKEQQRGIEQITKAISQMEQVTQSAAASAEEGAAAAEELSTQSDALKEIVAELGRLLGASSTVVTVPRVRNSPAKAVAPQLPLAKAPSIRPIPYSPIKHSSPNATGTSDAEFPVEESFTEF